MKPSPSLVRAVYAVWTQIAPDCIDIEDNTCAVEMCIDANRLDTFGFPEEEKEMHEAVMTYGYNVVLNAITKEVNLV